MSGTAKEGGQKSLCLILDFQSVPLPAFLWGLQSNDDNDPPPPSPPLPIQKKRTTYCDFWRFICINISVKDMLCYNKEELQMAASNTSHRMSRCQVVLNKRLLSETVLLTRIWVFKFFHNLSWWVLSQFEFYFYFVTVWVFEISQNLSWILSQFKFLILVAIQVLQYTIYIIKRHSESWRF